MAEVKPGQIWRAVDARGTVRIMAVVEGWVVGRFKGCMPWVKSMGEFLDEFTTTQEKSNG
jgi:hypothetical protein